MLETVTKEQVETACARFLEFGVGPEETGYVIIRSGALGAYVASRNHPGRWFDAYWTKDDASHVVDVTGEVVAKSEIFCGWWVVCYNRKIYI